ncbi:hypothetical protein ACPYO6_06670 [Georgenia sp. Z1344]|uniref:hypothetical protein n=1 Tax=Georgenia sp. Z1344 TaxID=3416706 RepID=UPI003CF5FD11
MSDETATRAAPPPADRPGTTGTDGTTPAPPAAHPRTARPLPARALLLLPGGLAMLAGLGGALALLGLAPDLPGVLADEHGWLMTLGFLGTVIALERSVALDRAWGYLAPALLGAGGLTLLAGRAEGRLLLAAGAVALAVTYLPLWRRTRDDAVLVQLLGAVLAAGAAILGARGIGMEVLHLWLAVFVVATIGGERLELARVAMPRSAGRVLVGLVGALAAACAVALLWPAVGFPLAGAATLGLTGWLAVHDVARRMVRRPGQPRFMAAAMLAGFAWLAVAGAIWLLGPPADAAYDAVIHCVFVGFALSMVMAHASVILPAVVRRPLPYHRAMWVPAGLLHLGLLARVWLGDGMGLTVVHRIGSTATVVALLGFVLVAVVAALTTGRTTAPPRTSERTRP